MDYNEVYNKTKEIIIGYLKLDENELNPDTNLLDDLCIDSIALVELGFRFSEEFGIPMIDGSMDLFVMKDVVKHICETMKK